MRAEIARRERQREIDRVARDADRIRQRCERLGGFVREAWPVLEPNQKLIWNWHLDALCEHLEAITFGQINRLLANVPPGSSKSLFVSVMWQAWEWTQPDLRSMRYLATSFNEGPVKRDTRKCRDLILSDWYRSLWPEVVLTRTGETSFANASTGTREGVAFGSLTSQRGDRLIIDDPHSTETAESAAEREATTRKFREGATNRLNDQERSAIVVIMQRLHEDDVSGVIKKLGMEYVHLCLPMEFEPDRRCSTIIGFTDPRRHAGDLLDPVRFPRATVEKLKRDMGSYAYAGQYQQRPSPRQGGLFQADKLKIVGAVPNDIADSVRYWDKAGTQDGGAFTAGVKMARTRSGLYVVLDVKRGQLSAGRREALIAQTAETDGRETDIWIEQEPGSGGKESAENTIRGLAGYTARADKVSGKGSKETRAEPYAAQVEVGNVVLLKGPWNEAFIEEHRMFPRGSLKDQVDAAAGAFNMLAGGPQPAKVKTKKLKGF